MSECIQWHKSLGTTGYGQIGVEGKMWRAHRWLWTQSNGPIPEGFVLDHVCHNEAAKNGECAGGLTCSHRACVNLEHLQLVSQSENIMNGLHGIDVKATCPKGHSYRDARNILVRKNGKRECAECGRVRANAHYWGKKVQVA